MFDYCYKCNGTGSKNYFSMVLRRNDCKVCKGSGFKHFDPWNKTESKYRKYLQQ